MNMKKFYILFSLFAMLLNGCSDVNDEFSTDFTIKGYVVTAPANTPLSGVLVRVTNDSYTLGSTSSNADGSFTLTINKSQLDNSYFLSLLDPKTEVIKHIDIKGVGLAEYDFGNIALYDSRNPLELPSFEYGGYTYVVHPILREQYSQEDAIRVCDNLSDCGLNTWFLPNMDELIEVFWSQSIYITGDYPTGEYWTSTSNTAMYFQNIHNAEGMRTSSHSANVASKYYVIPISRYK